ncbi:MAG: DUF488 domain-containing protein, partial [Anaerolineales bacterium]|nr:DUF488 domain-containing protein [Anaerolineales bacterium]
MRLYTIGFTQKSAKVFFEILKKHEVQLLIDIRLKPDGQLAGFTKKNDLPYFLVNLASGCLYEHAPDLAPTKEILKDYRNDGNWQLYVDRFEALMDDRGIPEKLDRTKFESLSKNVEEIFGQPIRTGPGHFVLDGQGSRSLGTIRPNRIIKAIYEQEPGGSIRYRLGFEDDAKDIYWLSVTDLTWRYYCDFQRRKGLPY